MKIIYLIGSFYPAQSGGPSNTIYWLARSLKKNGWNPVVCSTAKDITFEDVNLNKWLDTNYAKVRYSVELFNFLPVRSLMNFVSEIKTADVIHLNSLFYPGSIIAALLARVYQKPVVWSVRGELEQKALSYSSKRKKFFLKLIKSIVSKQVVFHSTSNKETENILSTFRSNQKLVQLPNYMELPNKVSRENDSNYILYIGRLHPVKAIDNLISALLESVFFKKKCYKLKIAGVFNVYAKELEKLVSDLGLTNKVVFLGEVKGKAKQQLYANAKCTILPSHSENFGNVVVESLAQNTPVIASNGTPWGILEKFNAGFYVNNDSASLGEAIDKILSMEESIYQSYRENSFKLVDQEFNIDNKVNLWKQVYLDVSQLL